MDAAAFALKCGTASGFGTIAGLYRDKATGEVISVPNEEAIAKLNPPPALDPKAMLRVYNRALVAIASGNYDSLSDEDLMVAAMVVKVPVKPFQQFIYELTSLQASIGTSVRPSTDEAKADSAPNPNN